MRSLLLALATFLMALVACGRTGPGEVVTPAPLRPAVQFGEVEVDGQRRTYRVFAPPSVGTGPPVPLVVALHDAFGDAESFRQITQLDRAAGAGNFVVVYPESMGDTWNVGFCCGRAPEQGIDDIGFLDSVLDDLTSEYPVDPARVFAVGASNGAMMAYQLVCQMADRIAGAAAVGGAMVMDDCAPERPVPILALHGTGDAHVPYEGGPTSGSPVIVPSQPVLMETWAQRNGCTNPISMKVNGLVTTATWEVDCRDSSVRLVTVEGGGHTWFSADFDGAAAAVDATGVITEFFDLASR